MKNELKELFAELLNLFKHIFFLTGMIVSLVMMVRLLFDMLFIFHVPGLKPPPLGG